MTYWIFLFQFPLIGLIDANRNRLINTKNEKSRRDIQGTHPDRMEVFTWCLRNGVSNVDINRVEAKVLMEHYQRMSGPMTSLGSSTLKVLRYVCPLYVTQFGRILKSQKTKAALRNTTSITLDHSQVDFKQIYQAKY